MKTPHQPWQGQAVAANEVSPPEPTGHAPAASSRLNWGPVRTHVALLRGSHRPEALVLMTTFPPRAKPGEQHGWSSYFLTTVGRILADDEHLLAALEADLRSRPGYSLGLVVNDPLPRPADWGNHPEDFSAPRIRDGQPQTAEQQQAERERSTLAWASNDSHSRQYVLGFSTEVGAPTPFSDQQRESALGGHR